VLNFGVKLWSYRKIKWPTVSTFSICTAIISNISTGSICIGRYFHGNIILNLESVVPQYSIS